VVRRFGAENAATMLQGFLDPARRSG